MSIPDEALPSLLTLVLKSKMGDGDEGEDRRELEGFLRDSASGLYGGSGAVSGELRRSL